MFKNVFKKYDEAVTIKSIGMNEYTSMEIDEFSVKARRMNFHPD
jgi:hypothetical protein